MVQYSAEVELRIRASSSSGRIQAEVELRPVGELTAAPLHHFTRGSPHFALTRHHAAPPRACVCSSVLSRCGVASDTVYPCTLRRALRKP
jgi:hypothetical protein